MGKQTDEQKLVKTYNKGTCLPLETNDMTAILNLTIDSCVKRQGRPYHYPPTKAGLEKFIQNSIDFFEYINGVNANPDIERKLIPDIENWAVYMGVTRTTIFAYEKRNNEWQEVIQFYKNAIGACKKQLALSHKIPPLIYIFDATNNHGYINASEFKIQATQENIDTDANRIERELSEKGLVWNEQTREFEPATEV